MATTLPSGPESSGTSFNSPAEEHKEGVYHGNFFCVSLSLREVADSELPETDARGAESAQGL